MQRRTVLLIRSEHLGWSEVRSALRSLDGVRLVGEAASFQDGLELATAYRPNVVILPERSGGRSAVSWLTAYYGEMPSSAAQPRLITIADSASDAARAETNAIAARLLWKDLSIATLQHLLAAGIFSNAVITSRDIAATLSLEHGKRCSDEKMVLSLNDRERAVLLLLADGLTHKEIARNQGLSLRTAERIVTALQTKFDAHNSFVLGWKVGQRDLV